MLTFKFMLIFGHTLIEDFYNTELFRVLNQRNASSVSGFQMGFFGGERDMKGRKFDLQSLLLYIDKRRKVT